MKNGEKSLPLVSFIITTHNLPTEKLRACIEKICSLSLNPKEREIILVDDGSEQSPLTHLADLVDTLLYIRQRHQGTAAAKNLGLHLANGKYIHFLEDAGLLISAPYEHCLDIVRYDSPDIVCLKESEGKKNDLPFTFDKPVSGGVYLHNNNLQWASWSYIFRRTLANNLKFISGNQYMDCVFTPLLFLRADKIIATPSEGYQTHASSADTCKEDRRSIARRITDKAAALYQLQEAVAPLPETYQVMLKRTLALQTLEYLMLCISQTRSSKHLKKAIAQLEQHGLYPLPENDYSKKYTMLRKTFQSNIGRKLLLFTVPHL